MAFTIFFIFHMIVKDNGAHHFRQIAIFRKVIEWDQKEIKNGVAFFWRFDTKNLPLIYR